MTPSFYQRYARTILWLTLLVLPFGLWGAVSAVRLTKNRIIDWLPANFEETQRLHWFADRFVSDEILAISWDGCNLDNEQVDSLVTSLQADYPFNDGRGEQPIFHEVISGRSVFKEMTSPPLNLLPQQARTRMQGWLLGKNENTTCIIARIVRNPDGTFSRDEAVSFVLDTSARLAAEQDETAPDLKIAGPTADSAAINRAGAENINWMRMAAVGFGLGLAWLGLRNLLQVANIFATAVLATLLSLASVYFCGQYMDAILLPLPALVFVLTISGAVHLTHYYTDAARKHSLDLAPTLAMKAGGVPLCMASITTMIGLASLSVSNVVPVRRFGLLAALGVGIGLACLILVWPALAQRFRMPVQSNPLPIPSANDSVSKRAWWLPLFHFSTVNRWGRSGIITLCVVALPLLTVGLSRINTSVNLSSLLPAKSPLLQSYEWFNTHIGPLVPVEVILQFPTASTDDARATFNRAHIVESLRAQIDGMEESGGTFAATTFAPELPTESGARQILQRRVLGQKLLNRRDLFVKRGLVATDGEQELWRVSTRVSTAMGDYAGFLDRLNHTVDTFVASQTVDETTDNSNNQSNDNAGEAASFSAKVCGSIPLIQKAQQQLLLDLIRSLLVAVGLIAIAMMLLLRNPLAGAISMIPNIFPSLLILGWMGFRGKVVDIGTMMTASVALGIAVDDTLHFLIWFRRSVDAGANRTDAIRTAFEKCAPAMLHTSIICGFGMLPFVCSSFGPVSRFAGGMTSLLAAALVGDLVILPAILASPLGRCFANAPLGPTEVEKTRAGEICPPPQDTPSTQFKPV